MSVYFQGWGAFFLGWGVAGTPVPPPSNVPAPVVMAANVARHIRDLSPREEQVLQVDEREEMDMAQIAAFVIERFS